MGILGLASEIHAGLYILENTGNEHIRYFDAIFVEKDHFVSKNFHYLCIAKELENGINGNNKPKRIYDMIVKREPRGDTKEAVKLSKFFSSRDNTVYPIQSDLQRRYCWPATHIEKFFKDYIIDLYEKNVEANLRGDDCFYAKIGDAILTRSEDDLLCDCRCKKQEVIDMSQRITTVMGIVVTMLYVHLRNIGMVDVDLRREIYNSYLRTKNGCSWKLVSTFKDNDFDAVIEDCICGSFKTDEESLRVMKRYFREGYKKKNSEGVYKPFRAICSYIYGIIDDTIGLDSDTIKDRLDMFLDQTYIQVEECEKEDRVINS